MKKYYIHTFGCKVNQYETQLISDKFKQEGFDTAKKPEEADIIVFNSCSVTAEADKECEYFLRKTEKLPHKPKIILTGCFAKNKAAYIKDKFPQIEILADKTTLFLEPEKQTIKNFDKRSRAFVKIQEGCNSFCSYCIVPYIRSTLWSKPQQTVIEEIKTLVGNGYSEVVLTGIHVGKYDGGISSLIENLLKIQHDFRIRISSIEINEIDVRLIELMAANPDKICRHLHIPLQSGSDEILKRMNRHYDTAAFKDKTDKILSALPDLALTTDIITGFPGESEAHHKESCKFVNKMPFARFHIFRYSDREGTKAYNFDNKVSPADLKTRSKELFDIDSAKRKEFLKKNSGKIRKAVSTGSNKALTDNYITVITAQKTPGIFEIEIGENAEI